MGGVNDASSGYLMDKGTDFAEKMSAELDKIVLLLLVSYLAQKISLAQNTTSVYYLKHRLICV